jgi:hypothetical protein
MKRWRWAIGGLLAITAPYLVQFSRMPNRRRLCCQSLLPAKKRTFSLLTKDRE